MYLRLGIFPELYKLLLMVLRINFLGQFFQLIIFFQLKLTTNDELKKKLLNKSRVLTQCRGSSRGAASRTQSVLSDTAGGHR